MQATYDRCKAEIPGNLAIYIFFKKWGELNLNRTVEFFWLAGLLYNPLMNDIEQQLSENEDEERSEEEDGQIAKYLFTYYLF